MIAVLLRAFECHICRKCIVCPIHTTRAADGLFPNQAFVDDTPPFPVVDLLFGAAQAPSAAEHDYRAGVRLSVLLMTRMYSQRA